MKKIIEERDLASIKVMSARRQDIFRALGRGRTRFEIAAEGKVEPKTIDAHIEQIKIQLDLPDTYKVRALATRYLIYLELNSI